MKLINDHDEVVHTCSDDAPIITIEEDGISAIFPAMDNDSKCPAHMLAASELLALLSEVGVEELAARFVARSRQ